MVGQKQKERAVKKMKFNSQHIILILLGLIVLNNVITWFIPNGMSNEEHDLKVKVFELEQERALLEKENNQLEFKIKSFENEILKL